MNKLISTSVLTCIFLCAASVARGQTYDHRYTFNGPPEDGANPYAGMIQSPDGTFFGTTANGGENNCGTVFRMGEAIGDMVLHHMATYEGCAPTGLLLASDGFFYGLTKNNGPSGAGTLFRMNADGQVTVLHPFDAATEGMGAVSPLIQATDGLLYGTMPSGGINGQGTVFRASLSGAITVLHAFGSGASDGIRPLSPLTQDWSGQLVFYGTTFYGGNPNPPDCDPCDRTPGGTVYQMTVNGDVGTMFYWFNFMVGGGNGDSPVGGLVQTGPTTLYGTTSSLAGLMSVVDPFNAGSIFELRTSGEFFGMSTVYAFPAFETSFSEGAMPFATLMRAGDGHLYGTTSGHPEIGGSTVFRFRLDDNTLESLHAIDDSFGAAAPLVEGIDGHLYGSTSGSIPYFDSPVLPGTLFRMVMDLSGVVKEDQTITFAPLPNKTTSASDFFVSATASSSLRVSFSASGTCTISGALVHLTGAGSCTITASQCGNAYYNAAVDVPRTFTITNPTPALTLAVSASSVTGGTSVTGTVTLTSPAPNGGAVVILTSSNPAVAVPATITIAKGKTSKTFAIGTSAVTSATPVSISATYGGTTAPASMTVNPSALKTVTLTPTGVKGGAAVSAKVTLTGPAPAGGLLVTLTSSTPSAAASTSVTVPAGATSATVSIATFKVSATTNVTITASGGGASASATMTVKK